MTRMQAIEDAINERRSLVRMLGMRRTMFVVPIDLAAIMDEACAKALAPTRVFPLHGGPVTLP